MATTPSIEVVWSRIRALKSDELGRDVLSRVLLSLQRLQRDRECFGSLSPAEGERAG